MKVSSKKGTKKWSPKKIAEFEKFLLCLFDRRIVAAPTSLIVEELSKFLTDKAWFEIGVLRPLSDFFDHCMRLHNGLRIRHRDFIFPIVGFSVTGGPLWMVDRTTLYFTSNSSNRRLIPLVLSLRFFKSEELLIGLFLVY